MTPQGLITARTPLRRSAVVATHHRRAHPAEVGRLFKGVGLFGDGAAPPPGPQT